LKTIIPVFSKEQPKLVYYAAKLVRLLSDLEFLYATGGLFRRPLRRRDGQQLHEEEGSRNSAVTGVGLAITEEAVISRVMRIITPVITDTRIFIRCASYQHFKAICQMIREVSPIAMYFVNRYADYHSRISARLR